MASKMMMCTTNGAFGTSRQASMYNTTLNESQNSLIESGKNFDGMEREEVLQNMWTTEERQAIATAVLGNVHSESEYEKAPYQSNLQHGNRKLSGTLADKTADEVWKEIQVQKRQHEQQIQLRGQLHEPQGGQDGGGEMTLEDFLVKAGIVRDDPEVRPRNNPPFASFGTAFAADGSISQAKIATQNQQKMDWYNYQMQEQQQQQFLLQQQAGVTTTMGGVTGPMGGILLGGNLLETPSDLRPGLAPGNVTSNQPLSPCLGTPDTATKRRCFEVVERTVERRQRRMIKNRESAARSRARKQAYTTELEMEVMQLKEENLRLKRQRVAQTGAPRLECKKPIRVLRRTRSLSDLASKPAC